MGEFWMELRPVDSYKIKANGTLTQDDFKIITMLYQPLMGADCLALYQTFFTEIEENRLSSETHAHTQLLNLLTISLERFFEARLKLEGLGLLKTYIKTTEDSPEYLYELFAPLSPRAFFADGLLNIYLYSKVGKRQYMRLKQFFSEKDTDLRDFSEITRSFQDVFKSFRHQPNMETMDDINMIQSRAGKNEIEMDDKDFDFSVLYGLLSPNLVARNQITPNVKQAILKLVSIYQTNEKEMVHFIYRALTSDGSIDIAELRKIVRDSYQLNHHRLPELRFREINKQESNTDTKSTQEEVPDEEALQVYLENVTPFQLLVDISDGAKPADTDLKVIDEVMAAQQLSEPVMNVLIEYVLLRLDGKISRNYMMTIAAHWKRKKVKTAKDAMELALSEHEKYKRLQEEPEKPHQTSKRSGYRKNNRKEVLPDWFDKTETKPAESKLSEKEKQTLEKKVAAIKKQLQER